jgi:hypothetical protein
MASTNDYIRTNIRGRLVETPVVRTSDSGKYSFLKVAVNKPDRREKDGGLSPVPPTFVTVAVSGFQAEYAEKYLHKGDEIELLDLDLEIKKSERETNGKTCVYYDAIFRLPFHERIRTCGSSHTSNPSATSEESVPDMTDTSDESINDEDEMETIDQLPF